MDKKVIYMNKEKIIEKSKAFARKHLWGISCVIGTIVCLPITYITLYLVIL